MNQVLFNDAYPPDPSAPRLSGDYTPYQPPTYPQINQPMHNTADSYPYQPNKKSGCLPIIQDPAWGFVFGFLSCILALATLILGLPQAAPVRQGISQVFAPASTPSPTLTPSPTPTPTIITYNPPLQIQIADRNPFSTLIQLELDDIVIDPAQKITTFHFTLADIGNKSCGYVVFSDIALIDEHNNTYVGGGQANQPAALVPGGQSEDRKIKFSLEPQHGLIYTLKTTITTLCEGDLSQVGYTETYQDETFPF